MVTSFGSYERTIARRVLLDAQSHWMGEADGAETPTLRTVAVVIADAFAQEARKYKEERGQGGEEGDLPTP